MRALGLLILALSAIWPSVLPARADVALSDAAGRYRILDDSSFIRFSVGQVGGGGIEGEFRRFTGRIVIDPRDISRSRVEISIDPSSVDAGERRITAFLRSDAVFDADNETAITFGSISVTRTGRSTAAIRGRLTARGRTFTESFDAGLEDLRGGRISFAVTGKVFRSRYGMDVGTPIYSNVVDFDMRLTGRRE